MNLAADYIGFRGLDYQNAEYGDGAAVQGRSEMTSSRHFTYTFNQLLNYSNLFGGHTIDVMLGHENYAYRYNYLYAGRTTFPFPGLQELATAAIATGSSSFENNYRTEGYLARVQYNYNDKYYLSGSFRRDGTSRFSQEVRWGNFYSVGASWRLTQEGFMQAIPWINQLKVRASYGTKGNDRFLYSSGTPNYFPWQGLFISGFDNNTRPGILIGSLSAPELRWEKKNSFNAGVDVGIINRITMAMDFFHDYSADLLFDKPLPISTGISTIPANIGDMKNVGIEFDINARVVNRNRFSWDINLNATHFKNTITKLPEEEMIQGTKKWMEGKSIYDFWIREYAGVNYETGKSLWWYDEIQEDAEGNPVLDENGDPVKTDNKLTTEVYSEADRYYVGSALPTIFGGITNTFRLREFDLSVILAYSLGGKVLDGNYLNLMHAGQYGDHMHVDILNRWTSSNTTSDIPWLDASDQDINGTSTRFLTNANYLVVRNITLGYTLPNSITGRIGMDNVRIFAAGDNLFTASARKGLDPGSDLVGITGFDHVPIRTISFGVNVGF
jgi:TonB-linked SusC/RagA family outer membrane protein